MRWHVTGDAISECRYVAEKLKGLGDTVVSSWLREDHSHINAAEAASQDIEDVAKSDGVVVILGELGQTDGSVEFGMALAFNKRLVLIGEPQRPAHFLPTVEKCGSVEEFVSIREEELT